MREIIAMSRAKVTVSPRYVLVRKSPGRSKQHIHLFKFQCRGELTADGNGHQQGAHNRVVTITGPPANAQTAHMLINQRLQVSYMQRSALSPLLPPIFHSFLLWYIKSAVSALI